jgi:hypothetical protein
MTLGPTFVFGNLACLYTLFVALDFTLYISYKAYCEVISKRILIIFAPEEAEIFKDYFFILA